MGWGGVAHAPRVCRAGSPSPAAVTGRTGALPPPLRCAPPPPHCWGRRDGAVPWGPRPPAGAALTHAAFFSPCWRGAKALGSVRPVPLLPQPRPPTSAHPCPPPTSCPPCAHRQWGHSGGTAHAGPATRRVPRAHPHQLRQPLGCEAVKQCVRAVWLGAPGARGQCLGARWRLRPCTRARWCTAAAAQQRPGAAPHTCTCTHTAAVAAAAAAAACCRADGVAGVA